MSDDRWMVDTIEEHYSPITMNVLSSIIKTVNRANNGKRGNVSIDGWSLADVTDFIIELVSEIEHLQTENIELRDVNESHMTMVMDRGYRIYEQGKIINLLQTAAIERDDEINDLKIAIRATQNGRQQACAYSNELVAEIERLQTENIDLCDDANEMLHVAAELLGSNVMLRAKVERLQTTVLDLENQLDNYRGLETIESQHFRRYTNEREARIDMAKHSVLGDVFDDDTLARLANGFDEGWIE